MQSVILYVAALSSQTTNQNVNEI